MLADDILAARWRVGRKLGRTLYAEAGGDDRDADAVLGMVDSREVAAHIVAVHNASLGRDREVRGAVGGVGVPALPGAALDGRDPET